MSDTELIFSIDCKGFAKDRLQALITRYGYEGAVRILDSSDNVEVSACVRLKMPIRAGQVLDQIKAKVNALNEPQRIEIGAISLDLRRSVLEGACYDVPVKLTEKEASLLQILAEAKGAAVGRDVLLDEVWRYVQSVETHTLETHIYRLRQKIERDPADPQILKTSDEGYYLAFENA